MSGINLEPNWHQGSGSFMHTWGRGGRGQPEKTQACQERKNIDDSAESGKVIIQTNPSKPQPSPSMDRAPKVCAQHAPSKSPVKGSQHHSKQGMEVAACNLFMRFGPNYILQRAGFNEQGFPKFVNFVTRPCPIRGNAAATLNPDVVPTCRGYQHWHANTTGRA